MTDSELIREFERTGDPARLNTLVGRHIGRVRGMIYAMVLNDADANDLTQEVFLKAVSNIGRFRGSARFSTWLHRIAMNTTRNFIRKKGRDRLVLGDTDPDRPDPAPRPGERLMAGEEEQLLTRALAALPPRLRSAFSLVVLQDMPAREAARVERCFLSTMYRRVDAARKALRHALGGVQ